MMRLKSMMAVSVLMIFLGGPLSAGAQGSDMMREDEVRQFIDTYVDRYKAMDVDLFMELYSPKAVENQMLPYGDIRAVYKRVFAETSQFLYYPTVHAVQTYGHYAFVTGRYNVIQSLKKGNKLRHFRGNIQWTLVREGGFLKIREINYGRSRGG